MRSEQTDANWTNVVGSRRVGPHEWDQPKLNCIAEVIEREHASPRSLAQRLDMTVSEVLASSKPTNNLRLSELYRWQSVSRADSRTRSTTSRRGSSLPAKRGSATTSRSFSTAWDGHMASSA